MKTFLILLTLTTTFLSCQTSPTSNELSSAKDTVISSTPNQKTAMQRVMDSIMKANPGATISFEGSDSTKIDASETIGLDPSKINLLNAKVVDSLVKTSKQKFTLLHFWATWCLPCRKEFPDLVKESGKLNNTALYLISSDYDSQEQRKKVLAVYQKLKTNLPLYLNEISDKTDGMGTLSQQKLLKQLGLNDQGGLPFNVVIDNKSKKVVFSSLDYKKAFEFVINQK